jgi:GDP-L-fucose synthase
MNERKILVTGGKGLVGSAINADVKIGKEYDLIEKNQCELMFETHKPTHVIHCAGTVGGLGANMNLKGKYFYDNIMINTNVIESCRKYDVKKLVSFLSTCVFPANVEYPLTEKKIHLGEPHYTNYPYAYAKRMSDIQTRAYREQYGLNYVSVIPTNIYGPNDKFSLTDGHVVPMLLHKLYLADLNKTDFIVWGTGDSLREFVYSKDIAKLAEWAIDNYDDEDPILFSSSEEISIKDLVYLIVKEFDFKGKVIFDTTKPDGQYRKPTDNSKLKSHLPNFEFTPIEVGLKETIKWFKENYDIARK